MEFDELQKVWDKQNGESYYIINEDALHRSIKSKKRAASKKANWMEIILIWANLLAGSMLLWAVLYKGKENETFIFILLTIMFIVPFYLLYKRNRRKKNENRFENTILGDVKHAINNASYTVSLSRTGQFYFIAIALLTIMSLIFDKNASLISLIGMSLFFLLTLYASNWEHNFYVKKKDELVKLKDKIDAEEMA